MKNMIDYIISEGQESFESLPFNQGDSLVFAQLAYFNYYFVTAEKKLKFADIRNDEMIEKMVKATWNEEANRQLLNHLIKSERFKEVEIINPLSILDASEEQQFAAVTFKLSPRRYCIAYRGTTSTFVGWKENFNMSYLEILPSQTSALNYYEKSQGEFPGAYYLVGHSKGGNLATYVGTVATEQSQKNLLAVYNFDGPGLQIPEHGSANHRKIKKFIPSASIIGILFEEEQNFLIAKSNKIGIFQHDLFSWELTEDNSIALATQLSWSALYAQRVSLSLLSSIDLETKREFLDSLYAISIQLGTPNLAEGLKPDLKNIEIIYRGLKNTDKHVRQSWRLVLKLLIATSLQSGFTKNDDKVS